jgi:hypothetical protein
VHNDVDPVLGHPIQVYNPQLITAANAALTVYADGSFTLIPTTSFAGLITFAYQLIDSVGRLSNVAQAIVQVDDAPDIHIYNGQNGKDAIGSIPGNLDSDDEYTKGAFTVANKNDTDADGKIDNAADETDVRPLPLAAAIITDRNANWSTLTVSTTDAAKFHDNQPVVITTADGRHESRTITIGDIQNDPNHKLLLLNIPLSQDPLSAGLALVVTAVGTAEVDLMKIVIDKPNGKIVGDLTLTVGDNAKIWAQPYKGKEVVPGPNGYISWSPNEIEEQFPKTLWVEATAVSQSVRDITLTVGYAGRQDIARATGICASVIDHQVGDIGYNAVYANAPWSDEPGGDPPRRGVKLLGATGKLPDHTDRHDKVDANGKPIPNPGVWNAIVVQFQVLPLLPAGEKWSQYGVSVDATQRMELLSYGRLGPNDAWLSGPKDSMPDQPDAPNDDGSDESVGVLDQGYYYHFDAPGLEEAANVLAGEELMQKWDFQTYLRIAIGPLTKAPGNYLWGSRASGFYDWHSIVHVTGQNGVWIRKVPGSSDIATQQIALTKP